MFQHRWCGGAMRTMGMEAKQARRIIFFVQDEFVLKKEHVNKER